MEILIVDDEKSIRDNTMIALEAEGHYAETADSGRICELRLKEENFDLVLLDLRLGDENGLDVLQVIQKKFPSVAVVVFTAYATIETAVNAIQLGAFDYLEKPFTPDQLRGLLARVSKHRQMTGRIEELEVQLDSQSPEPHFESDDPAMKGAYDVLFRAAATPASVLILGESGTGKSMVARAIHQRSHLSNQPFVTVHCPSLSKELLESELFGHTKGAFTGAVKDKWGKVHAANGGTLFLDEIGELPLDIQPKLLRLLQEREYERVGETKTRQADVRVIAATNRDLMADVEAGEFREDLYYRLNVISVEMPALRDRPRDLQFFATEFLNFFSKQTGRSIKGYSPAALASLNSYEWPGNLRELRNAIERAAILCRGDQIEPEDLPRSTGGVNGAHRETDSAIRLGGECSLEELEEEHIRRVLEYADTMNQASDILGIDQATLYRKRKRLGLK